MLQLAYIRGGNAFYPPGATFGPRLLTDYEFVLIHQGHARYVANNITHDAPPGTAILARPGFKEKYLWDPTNPTRHAFFHFLTDKLPTDLGPPDQWPIAQPLPNGDPIRPLFQYVIDTAAASPTSPGAKPVPTLCRIVEAMLAAFVAGPLSPTIARRLDAPDSVILALRHMQKILTTDPAALITLDDLAAAAHIHKHHLCRLFAETLHTRPMQVVLAFRIRHALTLMARSDLKLDRIATLAGFASGFHFSRRFTQFFGKSPSALRPQLITGQAPAHPLLTLINRIPT